MSLIFFTLLHVEAISLLRKQLQKFYKVVSTGETMQRCVQILFKLQLMLKVRNSIKKEHDVVIPNPSGKSFQLLGDRFHGPVFHFFWT